MENKDERAKLYIVNILGHEPIIDTDCLDFLIESHKRQREIVKEYNKELVKFERLKSSKMYRFLRFLKIVSE